MRIPSYLIILAVLKMSLNEIVGMGFVRVRQKQNFHPFDKANMLYDPGYMVQLSSFSEVWAELLRTS